MLVKMSLECEKKFCQRLNNQQQNLVAQSPKCHKVKLVVNAN